MEEEEKAGPPNKDLYALLHISPEASDEEIRKAYRQWAQVYHPDKYQSPHVYFPIHTYNSLIVNRFSVIWISILLSPVF